MRNRMYGGVRGRKTKVGRKLLRFPPTRLYARHRHARRLIRSGEPPARRLLGHVESRRALLRSRIGYVGRHAFRKSGCALCDSAPNRCVLPSRMPRRFPAYMPLCRDGEVSPSAHTQTGRSQLLLQLSALCWGLSWHCLISPLLPRREQ